MKKLNHKHEKVQIGDFFDYKVHHPLNSKWRVIKDRIFNQNNKGYHNYGGRGISICDEWKNDFMAFANWSIANGWYEKCGLSIDRKDNDGPYSPDNCRWANRKEQANNRRTNRNVTAWGETKTATEWSEDSRCNVGIHIIRKRIRQSISPEQAITQNTSKSPPITIFGVTKSIYEWSISPLCAVCYMILKRRIESGMDPFEAFATVAIQNNQKFKKEDQ